MFALPLKFVLRDFLSLPLRFNLALPQHQINDGLRTHIEIHRHRLPPLRQQHLDPLRDLLRTLALHLSRILRDVLTNARTGRNRRPNEVWWSRACHSALIWRDGWPDEMWWIGASSA